MDHDSIVHLPPGYPEDGRRYALLYPRDGRNLFDPATAYGGQAWRADETASMLIRDGEVDALILVGNYNAGQAHHYGRMLTEELNPFIDSEYRTLPDARHTGIGDSWLDGLVSLTIGLRYPDIFGKLAVMPPSVWRDHRAIPRTVAASPLHSRPRIWLDIGTAEGQSTTEDARRLRDMLSGKNWRDGLDLAYYEAGGAGHNERGWGDPRGLHVAIPGPP